ncbi:hypothetical protein FACS189434_12750 [Bacteroidia bacterium]|nr:hypothetical protein FACS189434_12750 [Bacteroidia bacterium]
MILLCFAYNYAVAQHSNLDRIKNYYSSIDKRYLIDSLFKYHIRMECQMIDTLTAWGLSIDTITINKWSAKSYQNLARIRNDSSVILLVPKFKNAVNYSFSKNIYDFVAIDTIETEIRYINIQKGEVTILNHNQFFCNNQHSKKELKDLKKLQEAIDREKPEVLFLGNWIFSNSEKNNNYLFLKGDEIYIYRSRYRDMYELNRFVRKFFSRDKDFKERAILNERGLVRVGHK